jgi:dihydrofolate reductase
VLRGDFVQEITRLKAGPGGDLLVAGSCQLVHGLTEHGLVDEFRLMVFPVVLGTGKRIFAETDQATKLQLASSDVVGDGILTLVYHPAPVESPAN